MSVTLWSDKNMQVTKSDRMVNDIQWIIDRYYYTVEDDCENGDEVLARIIQVVFPEDA
tara:strand:+ start:361 stop:534 length:174 start_codon:yes stop_codon:yes gene_type:complete